MEAPGMFNLIHRTDELRKRVANERTRLYRMCYSWCYEPALADDLAQEAITKALQKIHQLREPERLESWLYAILHNCWRTHLRQLRPDRPLDEEIIPCEDCPEQINQRQQIVESVRAAIARLPLGQREVITLVDLNGFTYAEVAEVMEIPIGTVMSRLNRGRKALQLALRDLDRTPAQRSSGNILRRVK